MIEDVEELGAEFRAEALVDLRALDQREVRIYEGRPDDRVSSEIAEMIDVSTIRTGNGRGREDRRILDPLHAEAGGWNTLTDLHSTGDIRAQREIAGRPAIVQDDI